MTKIPQKEAKLLDLFKLIDIESKTHRHEPLHSVQDSQKLRGNIDGAHCKNLFVKDKKSGLWLIVTLEDTKIDLNKLAKLLKVGRFSFCSSETMIEVLGVEPGSVTPFAVMNNNARNVRIVLDERMLENEVVNYHPLHNSATTSIKSKDLIKFLSYYKNDFEIMKIPEKDL